jgi:uncharacterized glyoxalase superfamily protein PhnB
MLMANKHPTLSTSISYRDPKAALAWLERVFGFEPSMIIVDADDNLVHSQMTFGDGMIMVGTEWTDEHRSPASIGGKNTQSVHVQLDEDVDAYCARAKAAGAEIIVEPGTQFYGDRTFRARDLEGHIWTFAQTVQEMTPDQWDAAMPGIKTILNK